MRKVLMIFVDGLGLGRDDPKNNPVNATVCPNLITAFRDHTIPIDACLGVQGIPQSATGQTALLTGINASQRVGRHVEGFPGPALRAIIEDHNIFKQLSHKGITSTFANGYLAKTAEEVHQHRVKSVTTVSALSAFGDVRRAHELAARKAVSHDLTREALVKRGYTGEFITPVEAASDLIEITKQHAFTLFEFFQTDRAGHECDLATAQNVLKKLDEFIKHLLELADSSEILVVLTSDHGNIEDLSVRTHTKNPIPFLAYGPGGAEIRSKVSDLTHITPALQEYLS